METLPLPLSFPPPNERHSILPRPAPICSLRASSGLPCLIPFILNHSKISSSSNSHGQLRHPVTGWWPSVAQLEISSRCSIVRLSSSWDPQDERRSWSIVFISVKLANYYIEKSREDIKSNDRSYYWFLAKWTMTVDNEAETFGCAPLGLQRQIHRRAGKSPFNDGGHHGNGELFWTFTNTQPGICYGSVHFWWMVKLYCLNFCASSQNFRLSVIALLHSFRLQGVHWSNIKLFSRKRTCIIWRRSRSWSQELLHQQTVCIQNWLLLACWATCPRACRELDWLDCIPPLGLAGWATPKQEFPEGFQVRSFWAW